MIFPSTYEITLVLVALAALCWGLWASTFKVSGDKWRYELYYFDFAFGTVLAATVASLTFGSLGLELTFWDNLTLTASKRLMLWAIFAGMVFNLGNMLLLASASVSGIATSFSIGIATALAVQACVQLATGSTGSTALLVSGPLALLGAVVLAAIAHRAHAAASTPAAPVEAATAAAALRQRRLAAGPKADVDAEGTPLKGILLAIAAGLFLGAVPYLIDETRHAEIGVGPYALCFLMGIGIFFSTLVFNLYFMNLPVKGAPLPFFRYLQGSFMQHLLGILGGVLWLSGLALSQVGLAAPKNMLPGAAVMAAPLPAGALLTVLLGLFFWREYSGSSTAVKGMLALAILLFGAGAALVAIAPAL